MYPRRRKTYWRKILSSYHYIPFIHNQTINMLARDLLDFVLEDNAQKVLTLFLIGICLVGCFGNCLTLVVFRFKNVIRHKLIHNSLIACLICDTIFLFVEYMSATIPVLLTVLEHQEKANQTGNQSGAIRRLNETSSGGSLTLNSTRNDDSSPLSQYKLDLLMYQDLWIMVAYPIAMITLTATIWIKCRLVTLVANESNKTTEEVSGREAEKPDWSLRMIIVGSIILNLVRFHEHQILPKEEEIVPRSFGSLYNFWYLRLLFLIVTYGIPIPILFYNCYKLGQNCFKSFKKGNFLTSDYKLRRKLRTFLTIFVIAIFLLITLSTSGFIFLVSSYILTNSFSREISSLAFHYIICINFTATFPLLYTLCNEFRAALNYVIFGIEERSHHDRRIVYVEEGDIVKRIKKSQKGNYIGLNEQTDETLL